MTKTNEKELSTKQQDELLAILATRFEKNMKRHKGLEWTKVLTRLKSNNMKLWTLSEMDRTGGEPDVIGYDKKKDVFIFCDCSAESPNGRRSLCYDREALQARKENKPKNNALDLSTEIGIELLSEDEYRSLQDFGPFDTKTSSWIKTPPQIRQLGGAIFADYRYGHVFVYHNGAESYYAARGFRGSLSV